MHNWQDWSNENPHGGWRGMFQARRGDMGPLLLRVLAERPMHGYEIIRHLEEKSHGLWRPSPGSVYPTLQLLEEQDLVTAVDHGGKKVYTLTDRGREEADNSATKAPWEWGDPAQLERMGEMKGAIVGVIRPFKSIARSGDAAKLKQAQTIMADAGTRLSDLLGPDKPKTDGASAR